MRHLGAQSKFRFGLLEGIDLANLILGFSNFVRMRAAFQNEKAAKVLLTT
jgi:hypothetical protein